MNNYKHQQRKVCEEYNSIFVQTLDSTKVGIALDTISKKPLNALRHSEENGANGWYIWGGESISEDQNFFQPLHASHLENICPEIIKFLGLAPGWRVLVTGEYLDIWYDEGLLKT